MTGLGARGDSYYEILAKEAVLNRSRTSSKAAFAQALDDIEQQLLCGPSPQSFVCERQPPRGYGAGAALARVFATKSQATSSAKDLVYKIDHLVCFLPATIAIALHHGVLPRGKGHLKPLADDWPLAGNVSAAGLGLATRPTRSPHIAPHVCEPIPNRARPPKRSRPQYQDGSCERVHLRIAARSTQLAPAGDSREPLLYVDAHPAEGVPPGGVANVPVVPPAFEATGRR
eukprot:1166070-Prymnesium_polylepis.1